MKDRFTGLVAGGVAGLARVARATAQDDDDVAAAGNDGTAEAGADGGAIAVGDVTSGFNEGNAIAAGDVWDGALAVEGGDVATSTSLGISADGGVAVADASGGDENVAFVS